MRVGEPTTSVEYVTDKIIPLRRNQRWTQAAQSGLLVLAVILLVLLAVLAIVGLASAE
mgnify:CR=1 FL=1